MDKQVLRTALVRLSPEDRLTVTFRGDKASQSGDYTVVRTMKGRGKGGSQLVELRSSTGETLVTGTPESDLILHVITADGTMHGHETEADVPPTFETDSARAVNLKEQFKALINYCEPLPKANDDDTRSRFKPRSEITLTVGSTHEPLAGQYTLAMVELKRGRYGKIVLSATNEEGDTVLLDSFQHSGIITSFEVSGTETAPA